MNTPYRENLEQEIRTLSRQCKCFGFDGPCRFCTQADKLNQKLDKLIAEDEVVRAIVDWLRVNDGPGAKQYHYFRMAADSIERGEWRSLTKSDV